MSFLDAIDKALAAAAKNENTKTADEHVTDQTIRKTAADNTTLLKQASEAVAVGRLIGHGFILELRKEAAAALNKMSLDGGVVSGSRITEPGSVTDRANKLPTNRDNPPKSQIDETKSVKHVTESDLTLPTKTQNSDKLVKKVSK